MKIIDKIVDKQNRCDGVIQFLERDVLRFSPDLVVVSFGLNDSGRELQGLEEYANALSSVFERIKESGAEIIFLTENCMCTKVSPNLTDPTLRKKVEELGVHQNTGMLDAYFDKAREVCSKYDVTVCDLYLVWQTMAQNGVNMTELLSNKLNHPTHEYHYYIVVN